MTLLLNIISIFKVYIVYGTLTLIILSIMDHEYESAKNIIFLIVFWPIILMVHLIDLFKEWRER